MTKMLLESHEKDVHRAVKILKDAGCSEIYLFGSLADGDPGEGSDVDLAVRGCPRGEFFHLWGKLMIELEHPVDLVSLDTQKLFSGYLEKAGVLNRIG